MKIKKWVTKKMDIDIKEITLLSEEEFTENKDIIPHRNPRWWLRTVDNRFSLCVGRSLQQQRLIPEVALRHGVSPVLIAELPSDIQRGDKLTIAGYKWTVLSPELIFCDDVITKMNFREDWEAPDSDLYEASDIKKWLNGWFAANIH